MNGKVFLIGAGPGDPDLLTVKALRLLGTADSVLYDELVTAKILALAVRAELYNVGKRAANKLTTQEAIHSLMIELSRSGRSVVRLKGGDPLLFARAAEEIAALREAGVPFEIVPGISAAPASAAAAEISLTDRLHSSGVVFLAGQNAETHPSNGWRHYIAAGATLAIYMPGRNNAEMARRLLGAGAAADTPCVLVANAARAEQQVHFCLLTDLHRLPTLPAPSLLIVGKVAHNATVHTSQHDRNSSLVLRELFATAPISSQMDGGAA